MAVRKRAQYYDVRPDYQGPLNWLDLINGESSQDNDNILSATRTRPNGVGILPRHPYRFPDHLETPLFLFSMKPGKAIRDIEAYDHFWCVSRRMKELLQEVDRGACEISPMRDHNAVRRAGSRILDWFGDTSPL
jgi:hypothetical protein